MFRGMSIKKKFISILILLLLISLPIVVGGGYLLLKTNAEREILKQADILISTMEATRHYVVEYTTPIFERETPGKFIVQGMADSFVNNVIFTQIEKEHPNYTYKEASTNPLNLKNKADRFEAKKIRQFRAGTVKDEWRGFVEKPKGKFYVVMKPVVVRDESCLSCHGDPDMAPDEVVKAHGKEHGYNWQVGDVAAVDAIYVPASVPIEKALGSLGLFAGSFIGFIIILGLAITFYLTHFIVNPITEMVDAAKKVSIGDFKHEFKAKTNDELKDLADAFNSMRSAIIRFIKAN